MDVIDGRISCTPQQAIELASFSMQAEFGNFDSERHTAHYLKDFQLFPRVKVQYIVNIQLKSKLEFYRFRTVRISH